MEIIFAMLTNPPRPLPEVKPDVPVELWQIIRQCISRVQAERYGTMAEVRDRLRKFLEAHPG